MNDGIIKEYTIKRNHDTSFDLKGTFETIKNYFEPSEEVSEDADVNLLFAFDYAETIDELIDATNKINDNGMEYFVSND